MGKAGAAEDRFGVSVAGLGDVDGDIHSEVIVGADRADPNGASSGRATVYSGETGAVLWETRQEAFDTNDMAVSDMCWDGQADLLVAGYVVGCVG